MKIIAVIPARGGSKSIPYKNIKLFCGKPLIAYSVKTALACSSINRVIVSSDSKDILELAHQNGAEVPFIRPKEISQDDTTDYPVFEHCLKYLNDHEGYKPDIIVQLRPTSPLRTPEMVEKAIHKLISRPEADSVRAVCEPSQNPFKMWRINNSGFIEPLLKDEKTNEPYNQPRQNLPYVYWQNGYIDVTRYSTIIEKKSMTGDQILPLIVDNSEIIDIDNDITFQFAEMIYSSKNK